MKSFGLENLSIEGQCLQNKLRVIAAVLFVFPCAVVAYVLYQQGLLARLDSLHVFIFALLLLLAYAGLRVLRQAFDKFIMVSVFMKKAEAGEMVMMDLQNDASELTEISISFNSLVNRLNETGRQMNRLQLELQEATSMRHRAEEALSPLRKAVDIMQLGVTIADMNKIIIYSNHAEARMHGYEVEELLGRDVRLLAPPEYRRKGPTENFRDMTHWSRECINIRKDGSRFPVWINSDAVKDAEGNTIAVVTTCEDITERKRAEEVLHLRQRVIESSSNGIMIIDMTLPENPIIYVNPAFERVTGYQSHETIGRNICFLLGEEQDQTGMTAIRNAISEKRDGNAVLRHYRKDGTLFWSDLSVSPVRDELEQVTHFVAVINDVTERERHEEQLKHNATHDALTGLPNRSLLIDRITQSFAIASRNSRRIAVMFIDLDNFKLVNDSLGHIFGDRLLQIQAERLLPCVRSCDTVARQGGDEFVIVLPDLLKGEDVVQVAHKIQETIARPIIIDDHELQISCSIGISIYPKDGRDVETLLKNADTAMYRAKEQGRNTMQFYTDEMNNRLLVRMTMEKHLRHALEMNELQVEYQPQVDLVSGRIVGMEALMRWQSPILGPVPPSTFIPLAEETGLIVPIGEWILRTSCEQNRAWQNAGIPPLVISVNLSSRQLYNKDLSLVFARVLEESGLAANCLELEIVESMVMRDVENAAVIMKELKALGIKLAMDDFGTGYSSLSYLKRFPFDKLKIDLSFVRDILIDPESATIARTIIAMAHTLNLRVIAEGVETIEQLDYLRANGCDEMQGYLFSRPVSARDMETMLRDERKLSLHHSAVC